MRTHRDGKTYLEAGIDLGPAMIAALNALGEELRVTYRDIGAADAAWKTQQLAIELDTYEEGVVFRVVRHPSAPPSVTDLVPDPSPALLELLTWSANGQKGPFTQRMDSAIDVAVQFGLVTGPTGDITDDGRALLAAHTK